MLLHYRFVRASRVIVQRGKRNIIGMDGAANEQDFDKYGDPKIEDDDDDDAIPNKSRRSRTTLPKGIRPFKRINLGIPGLNYANPKKKGKRIVKSKVAIYVCRVCVSVLA